MAAPADPAFAVPGFDNYRQEVYQAADQEQAAAAPIVAAEEETAAKETQLAESYAASEQPFTATPPVDHINEVMSGAPWLFALAALGGAAGKLNGQAMLQGLNGLSDGIIKGDQEALQQGWKTYQAAYDKWKEREDQKFRIYSVLHDAYGSAGDAKLRAMTAAQKMTSDAMAMKLDVDDPRKLAEIRSKLEESHARVLEAYAKVKAQNEAASDPGGMIRQVEGALADKGVTLPTGLRSRQQMKETIKGLIERHPNDTADQIADRVGEGQQEYKAEAKERQTAATVAGRVSVAGKELDKFSTLALQASAKVPRGSFVPITKLLQAGESSISDANLKKLKIAVTTVLNTYDLLAARGGTDKEKRAEAHRLITAADSPEALRAGLEQFQIEARGAMEAALEAEGRPAKSDDKPVQSDPFGWYKPGGPLYRAPGGQ